MNEQDSKRFLRIFLISSVLCLIGVASFNWIVDPFDFFQSYSWPGINKIKVSLERQQRMHKAIEIVRQHPQTLILGSSRPMVGIDPQDLAALKYPNVFNGSFSGASMEEIYHYFEHACYHQTEMKLVIIGIDLFSFCKKRGPQPDFSLPSLSGGTFSLDRKITSLLSVTAISSSFETLKKNCFEKIVPIFLPHGQYNPEAVAPIKKEEAESKDLEYIDLMHSSPLDYLRFDLDLEKVGFFEKIIQRCKEKSIEVKVFICPSKAVYWETIYRRDYWPKFEKLKRELCAIHPIWDFSGYNWVTTVKEESLNESFYFECSHFKPTLGKLIVDRIFEIPGAYGNFGYYLSPENIVETLQQIKKDRKDWLASKPQIIDKLCAKFMSVFVNHDPDQ